MTTSWPRPSPWLFSALLVLFGGALACCPRPSTVPDDGVGAPPAAVQPGDAEAIQLRLQRFHDAVAASDFETAYGLLSGRQRGRYTVETFRRDHQRAGSEPQALLDRLLAALATGEDPLIEGDHATFPLGGGLSLGLIREGGAWFIDRLR